MIKLLDKDLYTPQEVAEYLHVDIRTIYYWIEKNEMECVHISERLIRIKKTVLEDRINKK